MVLTVCIYKDMHLAIARHSKLSVSCFKCWWIAAKTSRSPSRCNNTAGLQSNGIGFCMFAARLLRVSRRGCNPAKPQPKHTLSPCAPSSRSVLACPLGSSYSPRPASDLIPSCCPCWARHARQSMDVARRGPAGATGQGREPHVSMAKCGLARFKLPCLPVAAGARLGRPFKTCDQLQ